MLKGISGIPLQRQNNFNFLLFVDWKSVVDICKQTSMYFTTDTHLIVTRTYSEECRCYIAGGLFRITITDLRLQSKSKRYCSSVSLIVQAREYDCSAPDYTNIFNQRIEGSVTKAFISVISSIKTSTAEMVWLTLQPEGLLISLLFGL